MGAWRNGVVDEFALARDRVRTATLEQAMAILPTDGAATARVDDDIVDDQGDAVWRADHVFDLGVGYLDIALIGAFRTGLIRVHEVGKFRYVGKEGLWLRCLGNRDIGLTAMGRRFPSTTPRGEEQDDESRSRARHERPLGGRETDHAQATLLAQVFVASRHKVLAESQVGKTRPR